MAWIWPLLLVPPCGATDARPFDVGGRSQVSLYVDGQTTARHGDGSKARPFKTIQAALDVAEPGTRVFVEAGTYPENIVIRRSGTTDKPILIEGARGEDGAPVAIIKGGREITNWTPAPEIGNGVYKVSGLGFVPNSLATDDGRTLDAFANDFRHPYMSDGTWRAFFTSDLDFETTPDNKEHVSKAAYARMPRIKFWDVTYGIFGTLDRVTYVRLKERSDPNLLRLRAAGTAHTIRFDGLSHIAFKGFRVQGHGAGFTVTGASAHHIVIRDNVISAGRASVVLSAGCHDVTVAGNDMTMDHYGVTGGTWYAATPTYEQNLKQALYQWPHHWIFNGVVGVGVRLSNAGDGNAVEGNSIHGGLLGVFLRNSNDVKTRGLKLRNNRIANHSSGGIAIYPGLVDGEICGNVLENNSWHVRLQNLQQPDSRRIFVYGNRFCQLVRRRLRPHSPVLHTEQHHLIESGPGHRRPAPEGESIVRSRRFRLQLGR